MQLNSQKVGKTGSVKVYKKYSTSTMNASISLYYIRKELKKKNENCKMLKRTEQLTRNECQKSIQLDSGKQTKMMRNTFAVC